MASPAHRSPALTLFHPATSSARSTGPHLTPASASYHFRDVAARICLEKGFAGIQAGALEQLEWEAERCACPEPRHWRCRDGRGAYS